MAKHDKLDVLISMMQQQQTQISELYGLIPSKAGTVETVETAETAETPQSNGSTVATPDPITGVVAEIGKSGYGIRLDGMERWLTIGKGQHAEVGPIFKDVAVGDTVKVTRRTTHRAIACTILNGAAPKTTVKDAPKVTAPKVTAPKVTAPKVTAPKVTAPKVTVETVKHTNGMCAFCQNQTKGGNPHSNDKAAGLECAVRQWTLSNGQGSFYADLLDGATQDAFHAWTLTVRPLKIWSHAACGWRYAFEDASASSVKTTPAARETAPAARETAPAARETTPAVKTGRGGPRDRCQGCNLYVKTGEQYHEKCRPVPTPPKGKGSRKATQPTITTVATTANAAQESTAALAPTVASELTWEDKLAAVKHPTSGSFRVTFVRPCDDPEKSDKDRTRPLVKIHSTEFAGHPNQQEPGAWLRANDVKVYHKLIGRPKNAVWNIDIVTLPGKSGGPVTYITKATQDRKSPAPDTAGVKGSGKNEPPVPAKKRQDDKPAERRAAMRKSGGQVSTAKLASDLCPKCSRRFSMVGRDASGIICTVCAATA